MVTSLSFLSLRAVARVNRGLCSSRRRAPRSDQEVRGDGGGGLFPRSSGDFLDLPRAFPRRVRAGVVDATQKRGEFILQGRTTAGIGVVFCIGLYRRSRVNLDDLEEYT